MGLRPRASPPLRRRLRAEHLAVRPRPGACRGRDVRRLAAPGSAPPCRSTTSAATVSSWPAGSPSYVDRLQRVIDSLSGARPLRDWLTALRDGITQLTAVADADAWQFGQVAARVRRRPAPTAGTARRHRAAAARRPRAAAPAPRRAADPRQLPHRHADRLHDGADALGAAPGGVPASASTTGCSRASGVVDGDDALARDPMTGERDIRSEDRQLLLDAIGAATEKLVITYTGANEHSGQRRPPAVPLAELLDTLDVTTAGAGPEAGPRRTPVAALRHSQCDTRCARHARGRRSRSTRPCSPAAGSPPVSVPTARRCSRRRCRRHRPTTSPSMT